MHVVDQSSERLVTAYQEGLLTLDVADSGDPLLPTTPRRRTIRSRRCRSTHLNWPSLDRQFLFRTPHTSDRLPSTDSFSPGCDKMNTR